ncbi:WXG100 family type VII secretion target [Arthrobacter cryoconiti]|uniref:ESAT-6-like protein n=1 Tax=Arthrobacter cryoconiti TaxID=748907 RepID=A0ABV8R5A4_9MICC|nr:WXG100 family type VII secretion target [Arthrobacter cryoconiti]MCC9066803.1 WXG100 family type VII secretion target [Arthrobacter cryoconiti]
MAQFNVNSEDLTLKSAAVKGSVDRIRMEVDAMKRNLLDLESTWTGAAATNFQALLQEWHATQIKVEASLESINSALSMAATQYAQAEDANTRMFTTR